MPDIIEITAKKIKYVVSLSTSIFFLRFFFIPLLPFQFLGNLILVSLLEQELDKIISRGHFPPQPFCDFGEKNSEIHKITNA